MAYRALLRRARQHTDSDACSFRRFYDLIVKRMQSSTDHCPFHHVLIALAESLPDCLLLVRLSRDGDTSPTSCYWLAIWRDTFRDVAKWYAFRRYEICR